MKTTIIKAGKVFGAGTAVCSVAIVVGMLASKLETNTAAYPLRVTPEFVLNVTGYFEGCRFKKYKDGGGIDTVGVGTTSAVCGKLTKDIYTYDEIVKFLNIGLWQSEQCINHNFAGEKLPQRVFESLVDMAYNNGCTAISNNKSGSMTKIRKYSLQYKFKDMCNSYMDWIYGRNAKGEKVVIQGLYKRRLADKEWCLKND